jgi:hypothetical protein
VEFEFAQEIYEKCSIMKQHDSLSIESGVASSGRTDRQTDGHDKDNSGFSQFCERAEKMSGDLG